MPGLEMLAIAVLTFSTCSITEVRLMLRILFCKFPNALADLSTCSVICRVEAWADSPTCSTTCTIFVNSANRFCTATKTFPSIFI